MNKNYLPYFNSLDEKEKTFWLDCSKEELIDHFIANVKNGEVLLHRIDKAIEYIKHAQNYGTMAQVMPHLKLYVNGDDLLEKLRDDNMWLEEDEILGGKEDE